MDVVECGLDTEIHGNQVDSVTYLPMILLQVNSVTLRIEYIRKRERKRINMSTVPSSDKC